MCFIYFHFFLIFTSWPIFLKFTLHQETLITTSHSTWEKRNNSQKRHLRQNVKLYIGVQKHLQGTNLAAKRFLSKVWKNVCALFSKKPNKTWSLNHCLNANSIWLWSELLKTMTNLSRECQTIRECFQVSISISGFSFTLFLISRSIGPT